MTTLAALAAACCSLAIAGCVGNDAVRSGATNRAAPEAAAQASDAPAADGYRTNDEPSILAAARALMLADENAALVTVDSDGQPRVRTVRAFPDMVDATDPARGLTVWIMTRRTTRKIEQIRQHPKVTLYFNDDATNSYLTIMGCADVLTDAQNPDAKRIYDDEYAAFFWPELQQDFVMIRVTPSWIEFMGPGVPNHPETWRPQAVAFAR